MSWREQQDRESMVREYLAEKPAADRQEAREDLGFTPCSTKAWRAHFALKNQAIASFVRPHPDFGVEAVAKHVGLKARAVMRMQAWHEHLVATGKVRKPKRRHKTAVPKFTSKMPMFKTTVSLDTGKGLRGMLARIEAKLDRVLRALD